MSDQENFDELIRQKLQNRKFDFDETKWNKAEALIEADEKKKKRRWGFLILSFGLMALLGCAALFYFNENGNKNNLIVSENSLTDPNIEKTKSSGTGSDQISNNSTTVKKEEERSNLNKTDKTIDNSGLLSNKETKNNIETDPKPDPIVKKKSNDDKPDLSNSKDPVTIKDDGMINITSGGTWTKKKKEKTTESDNKTGTTAQQDHSFPEKIKIPNQGNVHVETPLLFAFPVNYVSHAWPSSEPSGIVMITIPEKVTCNSKDDPKEEPELVKFGFFVAGGTNYFYGFSFSDTAAVGNSFGPFGGLGIKHDFTKSIGITSGIFYNSLAHVVSTPLVFGIKSKDLGYVTKRVDIKTNTMHYLFVPLWMELKVKTKNEFSIGMNIHYLLSTTSKVARYDESYGAQQGRTEKKEYGYMDGFYRFDIGIACGYSRKFGNRFGTSLLFNYGLKDIKRNDNFNSSLMDRNYSAQLFLTYDIIKK